MYDIWNYNYDQVDEVYQKNNFKIEMKKGNKKKRYCVIYCSSNNIWFPNEESAFKKSFVHGNRFEWSKTRVNFADKEIFVRDVYKSWYVTGINKQINTIDKLIDFLRLETQGYTVITIGSSSGGYLSALLGSILQAEYIISFSAQFELRNHYAKRVNPFLQMYENDEQSKYYDIREYIRDNKIPIFYIVPINNKADFYHYNLVKEIEFVYPIVFRSKHHGVVMYKCNLEKFISMDFLSLKKIYEDYDGKQIMPFLFSIKMSGVVETINDCFIEIKLNIMKIITQLSQL